MKNLSHHQLRQLWFKFWQKQRNHHHQPSVPLLNTDAADSLLWINSGVAGLKHLFLSPQVEHTRICNIQKAVRTDDLDLIGKTNRHLSFFEMMGNFSLGEEDVGGYGKEKAITWAWEFLTSKEWLDLDPSKIYITVFKEDQASIDICQKKLSIPLERLFLKGLKSNFWDLGVGPCGPNLEFFYDLGPEFEPTTTKKGLFLLEHDIENDRYLEIWNIVFSELFNLTHGHNAIFEHLLSTNQEIAYPSLRKRQNLTSSSKQDQKQPQTKRYLNLFRKNIDTGMGLERILTILQGKQSCFETDLFLDIITEIEKKCSTTFIRGVSNFKLTEQELKNNRRFKVIADHIRTVVFMLTDLLQLGKGWDFRNKHGYVIRQIIRNASLQGYFLGIRRPFLYKKLPAKIVELMGDVYSNLQNEINLSKNLSDLDKSENLSQLSRLAKIIYEEEEKFLRLILKSKVSREFLYSPKDRIWSGKEIFRLVTESGLPFSFLQQIAEDRGLSFVQVEDEYQQAMDQHKLKSQNLANQTWFDKKKLITWSDFAKTTFFEKETTMPNVKVLGILPAIEDESWKLSESTNNVNFASSLSKGEKGWVLFDKTPFYARKGGQEPDHGKVFNTDVSAKVIDVICNERLQYAHLLEIKRGVLDVDDLVNLEIDITKRKLTANNHSATHLLHGLLRQCLGEDVQQNGSFNNHEILKLDFFSRSSKEEIAHQLPTIEKTFLAKIGDNLPAQIRWVSREQAKKENALDFFDVDKFFTEKVRIVQFGDFSKELCGGTHVKTTGDISDFVIFAFKKIGQNIYRIYARTHEYAAKLKKQQIVTFDQKSNWHSSFDRAIWKKFLLSDLKKFDDQMSRHDFWQAIFQNDLESASSEYSFVSSKIQWKVNYLEKGKNFQKHQWSEITYLEKEKMFQNLLIKFRTFKRKQMIASLEMLVNTYFANLTIKPSSSFIYHEIDLAANLKDRDFHKFSSEEYWIYPSDKEALLNSPHFNYWMFIRKVFDQFKTQCTYPFVVYKRRSNTWLFSIKVDQTIVSQFKSYLETTKTPGLHFFFQNDKCIGFSRTSPKTLFNWLKKELQVKT